MAITTIVALLMSLLPIGLVEVLAARTGVSLSAVAGTTADVGVGVRLLVTVTDDGDKSGTVSLELTDNGGGTFYQANASVCTNELGSTPQSLTVASGTSNRNFCYSNANPGVHSVSVVARVDGEVIGSDGITITINAPTSEPIAPTITLNPLNATYQAGDILMISGSGVNNEDGLNERDLLGIVKYGGTCQGGAVDDTPVTNFANSAIITGNTFTYVAGVLLPSDIPLGTYSYQVVMWDTNLTQTLAGSECRSFDIVGEEEEEDEPSNGGGNGGGNNNMITICHATASQNNPYVTQTVNKNSITNPGGHGNSGVNANDIIPPFDDYPGQNWTEDNQAIWENDCQVPIGPEPTKTITMCKLDGYEQPVAGWGMEVWLGENESPTHSLLTGEDGCVSIDVPVNQLPAYIYEEERADWVPVDAWAVNAQMLDIEVVNDEEEYEPTGYQYCRIPGGYDLQFMKFNEDNPNFECWFMNEYDKTPTPQCTSLLLNGSFEEPLVNDPSLWQKFASVVGWVVERVSDLTVTTLEIHKGWSGNEAAEGAQYAELDGDHSTQVSQTVTLIPGAEYQLSWAFAGRHDIAAEQNQLSVRVNGTEVTTHGPVTMSAGLASDDWLRSDYAFTAATTSHTFTFADVGPSDSYGTFLDDIKLCLIREPEIDGGNNNDDDNGTGSTPARRGGGSRSTPSVLGDSVSADDLFGHGGAIATPMVLGEQVSVVPVGAPNTGRGGVAQVPPSNNVWSYVLTILRGYNN